VNDTQSAVPPIHERLIQSTDWVEQYRQSVTPVFITPDIVIRPPWCETDPSARFEIIVEPSMAFGTGTHETTRSCLRVIRDEFQRGMRFLDVGCGSGVLSILTAKMGASFVKAVDTVGSAVENCRENFRINAVTAPSETMHGSIELCVNDEPYDFVCANIIKSTILSMLPELVRLTADNGLLVLSGLLDRDETEVSRRLRDCGMTRFAVLRDNEWRTYRVHKG
jgi:ribosomal protein L11 methyltransferase